MAFRHMISLVQNPNNLTPPGSHLSTLFHFRVRSGKLILPDKNLTTDQKLNKIGILNLHKQLDYKKDVFLHFDLKYKIVGA